MSRVSIIQGPVERVILVDQYGVPIISASGTGGSSSISAAVVQHVEADPNNSSTTNLTAANGYTFTGVGTSSLGIAGIQVSLYANQNCIVRVQQSPDNINWDLGDPFYYTANGNFGVTAQAVSSYLRVVVTTMNATTTIFRLQTALCPIVEAVPRTLDPQGNFKVSLQGDNFGNGPATFTPNQELMVSERVRLIGAQFVGSTIDPNFWTTSVSTGTVTQSNSNIQITSGTIAGHYARLYSFRRSRFVSGSTNKFRCHLRLGDTGTTNVRRRWGALYGATMPTITDGAYFELWDNTFSVVTLKGGVENRVSSGSFNGQYGYTYAPTLNNTVYEILISNGSATFIIGGIPLHKITGATSTWTNNLELHCWSDVVNNGNSAAVSHFIRTMNISRLGQLATQATSAWQSGTIASRILKYSAGNVHGLNISAVLNNANVTLWDNTAASGTTIYSTGAMGATTQPVSIDLFDAPFFTGLTLSITGANCNAMVAYE